MSSEKMFALVLKKKGGWKEIVLATWKYEIFFSSFMQSLKRWKYEKYFYVSLQVYRWFFFSLINISPIKLQSRGKMKIPSFCTAVPEKHRTWIHASVKRHFFPILLSFPQPSFPFVLFEYAKHIHLTRDHASR
jgi:hypothetical protein